MGRPSKATSETSIESLQITIKDPKALECSYWDVPSQHGDAAALLCIPNRLLHHWETTQTRKHRPCAEAFVRLANRYIIDEIVTLNPSVRLGLAISHRARDVCKKIRNAGGKRQVILDDSSHVYLLKGEVLSYAQLIEERDQALEEAERFRAKVHQMEGEVEQLYQQMKEYNLYKAAQEPLQNKNKGKPLDELSARQAKRKLTEFQTKAQRALWFAQTFGIELEALQGHTTSGKEVTIPLSASGGTSSTPTPDPSDHEVLQILYLLERYGVGDSFYHELSMVDPTLPHSSKVKRERYDLNQHINIEKIPGYTGAYRPFESTLQQQIATLLENHPDVFVPGDTIPVKVSGDGAKFSRTSNFILLSFGIVCPEANTLSGVGNHTVAVVKGEESYNTIAEAFRPTLDEVNSLVDRGKIEVNGREYNLEFFLVADYKFLLIMLGMNAAHSIYACTWCQISRDERWDMSRDEEEFTMMRARSLDELRTAACSSAQSVSSHSRKGSLHPPLLNIELNHVILDELHLLLRIFDVFLRNLLHMAIVLDLRQYTAPPFRNEGSYLSMWCHI